MHWTGSDIAAAAAVATVVGALIGLAWRKGIRPIVKFLGEFRDDWIGIPARPGVAARPGVMERLSDQDDTLARIDKRVATVESQVKPNGGASMHDAVNRIEQTVAALPQVPEIHLHAGGSER